ncbi:TM2 domain-containing protein [Tepidamorphus sp. 3E244]|uniref:TM2 domain-containing protein n=1 Tax=Tepidamorphus sp. 3E244 TaxID=3385498 RepID=UPI0038FCC3CE
MSLTTEQEILIESRVSNERKSAGAAYLLWFFLGIFSAHRFYLGRPISAILQVLSYFILVGFIWWVIDLFLIPGIIQEDADEVRRDLVARYRNEALPRR